MKTVKSRVVLLMTAMTILICAALGIMSVALNRLTAEGVLKQSMTQVAALAAARIDKEVDITKQVTIDTGCMPNMGKAYISSLDKKKIVQQQAQAHGLTGGNLLDINGISVFDGTDFSDRDYYQAAMKGEAFVSGPMLSKLTDEYVVVIAAPVWTGRWVPKSQGWCISSPTCPCFRPSSPTSASVKRARLISSTGTGW